MQPTDDSTLLRQYADHNSDEAFAALVTRHINLVYSVALRQVGNTHAAEEITQAVFIIPAKKAAQLRHDKALGSWLFQATRLTANNFVRSETRRHRREEEAYMQSVLDESATGAWPKIAPLLDDAVAGLREKDRQAIVLRFYEGRNLRDVGLALGASEDAAEKRVNRALEKLRKFFSKRGVTFSSVAIAGTISANSVQAAPVALAKSVTAVAIAKGAAASGSTLTLIKGALKIMAWSKAKMVIGVGVVAILVATSTTLIGIKLAKADSANAKQPDGLSPKVAKLAASIQSDGTILFQATVEETNRTGRTIFTDVFNSPVDLNQTTITDELGQPMKFTKRPGRGRSYLVTLNKAVPPGGNVSYTMEGTANDVLKLYNGVCDFGFVESPGNDRDLRMIEVWRLPAGAKLLKKDPADLIQTTNNDQIELKIDKIIPHDGKLEIALNFRLPAK
jgi:RNA polymerase sigma factor (sigma-70 family)